MLCLKSSYKMHYVWLHLKNDTITQTVDTTASNGISCLEGGGKTRQGLEALRRFFAPVMDGAENFKFKNIKIFPGEDENHVSGEYEVDALIKNTGRRYRQLYGGRLIAENGKIKLLREFCDTVEVARAMFPNGVKDLVQKD